MNMEWKDIITAPTNGDEFLGYDEAYDPNRAIVCEWRLGLFLTNDGYGAMSQVNPTHWMPLPPPPAK